jgi:hypothetical protein
MLEFPAITGKEPYVVWQLIRQLHTIIRNTIGRDKPSLTLVGGRGLYERKAPVLLRDVLQKREANAPANTLWSSLDEVAREYLIYRASDLVEFGDVIADRTFPQPSLPGIAPQEVSRVVTALMILLEAAQGKEAARLDALLLSYHAREVTY